jgi:hypothetical protein
VKRVACDKTKKSRKGEGKFMTDEPIAELFSDPGVAARVQGLRDQLNEKYEAWKLGQTGSAPVNLDLEIAKFQRDQFAHYIVRIAVALGIVDGKQTYTGEQTAFLATTAIEAICKANMQKNAQFAVERKSLLDAMPSLVESRS